VEELEFRRDLYTGTARYYDRFRVPYPRSLADDLAARAGADGEGRLLDLGCGPGLISFALHRHFGQIWAVDQEPEMIDVVREKAQAADIGSIRPLVADAADLSAPEEAFDLVTIGNAFHRLPRTAVADRVWRWLRPGRFLALLWSEGPWPGPAPWQQVASQVADEWKTRTGASARIPAGYAADREQRPDRDVLAGAGFEVVGSYTFPAVHEWTPDSLIGYAFSTSTLSRSALGRSAGSFEADLRRALSAFAPADPLTQTIRFAYVLARRPGPGPGSAIMSR
jgi:SAM-dependent methyltransferase